MIFIIIFPVTHFTVRWHLIPQIPYSMSSRYTVKKKVYLSKGHLAMIIL